MKLFARMVSALERIATALEQLVPAVQQATREYHYTISTEDVSGDFMQRIDTAKAVRTAVQRATREQRYRQSITQGGDGSVTYATDYPQPSDADIERDYDEILGRTDESARRVE